MLAQQPLQQGSVRAFSTENDAADPDTGLNAVKSIFDKINDVTVLNNGEVRHNYFTTQENEQKGTQQARRFKNMAKFEAWRAKHVKMLKESYRDRLTPHQYNVTQNKCTERAFTGDYWWVKDVGRYDCVVCSQRLFLYEHKYINRSGYPTFWTSLKDAVRFSTDSLETPRVTNAHEDPTLKNKEAIRRISCSNCEAHLGQVFADGPPPLGLRF